MGGLSSNLKEKVNVESFSSDNSYVNFHDIPFELRELEKRLINEYFVRKDGRVLDLGCGYGRTTVPLAHMGYHIIGTDVVPRMIETAKAEHPEIEFKLMSATDITFGDSQFDYILFSYNGIDCIYPEERRTQALKEIWRCLKPGGICILTSYNSATRFTLPRKNTLKIFWDKIKSGLLFSPYWPISFHVGRHILFHRMPYAQVRDFNVAGFDVLKVTGKMHTSWLPINLFEIWPYYVLRAVK